MQQPYVENRVPGESEVLTFPSGLVGLPEMRRWILVDMEPPLPMKWLKSLDREGFRVPVTDPGFFTEQYSFEIDDASQKVVQAEGIDDVVVMIISTVHAGGSRVTGNLSAPLVVNVTNRIGVQCVLEIGNYSLRQEIHSQRFGDACLAYAAGHPENVVGTAVDKVMQASYDQARAADPRERELDEELIDAR
ncbi:flagellar assembly protein FliW [bacterium]|nr:flagellar assembly protein FliW [bacterium]MBU1074207.1 flagellar assembly protein FliW [bacterium]MBU1674893.1 flagellar assembly protein FliW [bacterium]